VSKKQILELAADSPPTRRGATFLVGRRRVAADSPPTRRGATFLVGRWVGTRHRLATDSRPTRRSV